MQTKLHRIYLSHLTSQVSNHSDKAPQNHVSRWQYTLAIHHQAVSNSQYEVSLTLNAEQKQGETSLAILDIKQSGLFGIQAANQEELAYALAVLCPQTLFSHLQRQAFAFSSHMGVIKLELPYTDFNQAYTQQLHKSLQLEVPSKVKTVQEINKPEDNAAYRKSIEKRKDKLKDSPIQRQSIVIPEQALVMVLMKLFENTLSTIKHWWNRTMSKAEGEEVSIEELIQSHAALQGLNTKIDKWLKQKTVEGWCRYHLEDLADEIQTADKSSITRKKAQGWKKDFQVLREDFEPKVEHLALTRRY